MLIWFHLMKYSTAAKMFTMPIILFCIVLIPICIMFQKELPAQKLSIVVFYIFSATIINKALSIIELNEKRKNCNKSWM